MGNEPGVPDEHPAKQRARPVPPPPAPPVPPRTAARPVPVPGRDVPRPVVRWWLPTLLGAALPLTLLAAFPPWPADLDLGASPWWVVAPAATVTLLLVLGIAGRLWAGGATVLACVATWLGGVAFVRSAGDEPGVHASLAEMLAGQDPYRAAPLAAAFGCLVAAVAGLALVVRRRAWLDPSPPAGLRRGFQRLVAWTLVGGVLGTGLHLGAGLGARQLGVAMAEDGHTPVDAVSEPVPQADRPLGTEMPYGERDNIQPGEPGEVAWEATLPGAAELSTCPAEWPMPGLEPVMVHTTVVSVVEEADGDAVVGYDAEDGSEQWRYTVRAREGDPVHEDSNDRQTWPDTVRSEGESRLGQVAVAAPCTVLAVVEPYSVVALDAATGDVRNVATLPVNHHGDRYASDLLDQDPLSWRFPTPSLPEQGEHPREEWETTDGAEHSGGHWVHDAPRIVPLDESDVAYLAGPYGLLELDRYDGTPLGLSRSSSNSCAYLVDYGPPVRVLVQECVSPVVIEPAALPSHLPLASDEQAVPDGDLADLHGVLSHHAVAVPRFGCDTQPRVSDLRTVNDDDTLVVGTWCAERHDGPLMVRDLNVRFPPDDPVTLPAETPRPLHPSSDFRPGWLDEDGALTDLALAMGRADTPLYTGDDPLAAVLWPGYVDSSERPFYGVTESGTLLALELPDGEGPGREVLPVGSTDVAAAPCAGDRDIRFDRANEHVLLLCRTEEETTVTAVTDGAGFVPAGAGAD